VKVSLVKKKPKTGGKGRDDDGVDISDIERSFSHKEWRILYQETRSIIQALRKAKKEKRSMNKTVTSRDDIESQDDSAQ
jgi:hypothetical protein